MGLEPSASHGPWGDALTCEPTSPLLVLEEQRLEVEASVLFTNTAKAGRLVVIVKLY